MGATRQNAQEDNYNIAFYTYLFVCFYIQVSIIIIIV